MGVHVLLSIWRSTCLRTSWNIRNSWQIQN
jgi:hypothetical protein